MAAGATGIRASTAGINAILVGLVIVSACVVLMLGPIRLNPGQLLQGIIDPIRTHTISAPSDALGVIVWQLRLPRIVLEALVGGSLALAGLCFQALLRNDLAEGYTTGVSAGSSVGIGVVIVAGGSLALNGLLVPLAAFGGGTGALLLIYSASRVGGRIDVRTMLLMGVITTAFLYAIQMLLLTLAGRNSDEILRALLGSLANATWQNCGMMTVAACIGTALLTGQAYAMNLFSLGETSAQQLGLDTERFKRIIIIAASLLTAATVATAGIIAFVGLVVPHIARRLVETPDHRTVLPATVLCGALMLIWSDTIARVILGGDRIPVGVVTAFWGGPFFWYLLRRANRSPR